MRSIVFVVALLTLAGCTSKPIAEEVKSEPLAEYSLRGEIISIDTQTSTAKIKHEAIGDWMGAMTMDFPVKDAKELGTLKPGQYIEGKVYVRGLDYWAGAFQPGTAPAPAETK